MNPNQYFDTLLSIDPIYQVEGQFFKPFWDFQYRFQSLQRHWILNRGFVANHISILKNVKHESAESSDMFAETAGVDIDYFPEYVRLSTISFSLSLVENLLSDLSQDIADDLKVEIDLDKRPLPYINKYILWLTRGCGLEIDFDKSLWKSLDAIRELRNRFIHKIDRDIPDQVKIVISEMISAATENSAIINDEFVDTALLRLSELVKKIELAYIRFYEKRISTQ